MRILGYAALALLPAVVSAAARPDAPQPVPVRAFDPAVATTRTWFSATHAGEAEAIAFRLHLIDAGARHVNLFLPDRVIVCDFPDHLEVPLDVPAGFARASWSRLASQPARESGSSAWIEEAYRNADRPPATARTGTPDGFRDVVVTLPPERVAEIDRAVEKSRRQRGLAPRVENMVDIAHGSSFLGGSITANFIFPESDGRLETSLENWSDADLSAAKQGAVEAMISWQSFPNMDVSFVFHMEERVATGYEPILHTMRDDPAWMLDVLRTMGWGHGTDLMAAVHEYNQAQRARSGTQWVFTAFIACSRNTPDHKFGNGTADYTAYAFLGGPCLVQPFPSGADINGVGERLVYSQIVNHEAGHCFWTLDEYPGAPGACGSASGYLNYGNGNLSTLSPNGSEFRCHPLQECIMHTAARKSIFPRPWCEWSRGHLGVIDNDRNGLPDIFQAPPDIQFESGPVDTIYTNEYTMRFRVVAGAVPNRNPRIAPDRRVSYAAPLRRGWVGLGLTRLPTLPVDGKWDEVVEDCEFHVSLATVGATTFGVDAENAIGFGATATKTVHFIGVNYTRTAVTARHNRNTVSWEISGNPFGAKFNVYRLDEGEPMPGRLIRQNVGPSGPAEAGFIPYAADDFDIMPGRDYRYYVEGAFTLPFEGGTRDYMSRSKVIEKTAMIPLAGAVISHIVPNPSRGAVTLSVAVPRTYGGPAHAPLREPTPVDVSIFNVNGQLVRTLTSGGSLEDVMTLRWDGTDRKQRPAPSGVYFVRATAGPSHGLQKIVLIR